MSAACKRGVDLQRHAKLAHRLVKSLHVVEVEAACLLCQGERLLYLEQVVRASLQFFLPWDTAFDEVPACTALPDPLSSWRKKERLIY